LTQALRSSHGVDVSDVPVHRDPAAGAEARERRARAFTRGGRVFLPEEAGALHSGPARGLLAHELVHVAQQRRLGSSLPGEETPEGQALEAEAQHAERMYSTDAFPEPELVHAPPPVSAGWVEDRITQHAFMTQPAGYPGVMTGQGGENLVNEVKYAATEVIKKAIEEGDLGGSGSGSGGAGGRNPNVPLGVGIGQAQNEGEFQAQMLAAINAQRLAARQSAYANFSDLDEADRDRIMARYREVANQNADAIAQSQMQVAVQHLAQQQHLAWTPERQFHVPDESPTNAPTSSSGSTPTPPGTPPSTTAGTTTPTAPSTTPTPRTPRTTTPPAPQPPPTGYDIGIGHAHTWEEFRDQVLIAVNVDRDANEHMSWESLSRADQQRIEHRWDELKAAQATTARNARIQAALDQSRRRTPTPTTPEPTAPPSEQATLAAGALAGAQVADARNAAEHTNDLETDSGITNTTSSGHPAISVDRIDMDDLTTRLYERLRSRLRMELLVDRERAGLLTDFR
jgi:hypothetical protein